MQSNCFEINVPKMNWSHKILCLFVVITFTSYCVNAENSENINLNNGEEELIPPEQILGTHDAEMFKRKASAQLSNTQLRQNCAPYLNGWNFANNIGFPFDHGLIANPLVGHSLDAQASSPSNNVVLVLANEKNKLAELTKPAEEALKRLVRNPDDVERLNLFGGNMAQRMFQQVAQTAPELSRSFGQALREVLAQTSALAQTSPGNFNLSQLTPGLGPVQRPENFDFGQLGQRLSQSFLLGAAPNLLKSQTSENTKEAEPVTATEQAAAEAAPSLTQQNPLAGHPLLPPLNFGLPPMGVFRPLRLFNHLMPLASEISEVRVKPDDYNPYKLTPKEVDHQTMAEMRLKALLRDALAKKTIPILWFHLPSSQDVHKSSEDLETEAKLKIFENQVIAELEQLQELSKLANELKMSQLQSGSNPTPSLTTKLNLSEIPIYDITLGDIEKTLADEHVRMLMHTIAQNQNKELHRYHQATTQYLTDLTGNPIKRQTSADDILKTMEKDDLLKMMTYAYRMAATNGQMPWLTSEEQTQSMAMAAEKQTKMNDEAKPTDMSSQMLMQNPTTPPQIPTETINQRQMPQLMANGPSSAGQNTFAMQWADHNMPIQRQSMMSNTEMAMEKQWLEDKQRQMLVEAEQQRKINDETRTSDAQQNEFSSQSVNLNMPTQSQSMVGNTDMTAEKQWFSDKQRQMALEAAMQTKMNNEGRSTDMSSQMLMQNPTTPPQRPTEAINQRQIPQKMPNGKPTDTHPNTFARQWFDQNMVSQMLMQNPTTPPQRPTEAINQRQIPQQMMILQNPTTPPQRPPPQTIMERQIPQQMMIMQNPTTPPQRPPPQTIMERQIPQQMMIMQNPTTPPQRPPQQTIMERQIPQGMPKERPTDIHPNTFARQWFDQNMLSQMLMQNPTTPPQRPTEAINQRQIPQQMMIMQNPTTPPQRPPQKTIMGRQIPQQMMIMQNPTTPPQRPPPQTIMERQIPQQMMIMQNPTTPPQRPPQQTIMERQIPQGMPKERPTDIHPNTFARQWFDQNMLSQMLMQNPTTPPHRPPPQTIMERQTPQEMMTMQNPTTPPQRPPPQTIMERQTPQEMMIMQNPTTPPQRPPPQTIMERQIPQQMMIMQNPTTPPQRPPPQTIMERQIPQQMMIMQNPTTPPNRPPPQTIMERQKPQEIMIMQNPTTPPHRPPQQTIMERQIPQEMPNGIPSNTHSNTFARQWFDQNMLSQMLMQNPTTPPQRPPSQTIMERQIPQEMITLTPPQIITKKQTTQEMTNAPSGAEKETKINYEGKVIMQNSTIPPYRPPLLTITQTQTPQIMINNEPWVLSMPTQPEQKQEMDVKSNYQQSTTEAIQEQGSDSVTDPKDTNPTLVEATPQTAEDADKPRFGGLKNLFDLDVFHHGKDKVKQEKPTVINYYYNTGGSRYPPGYNGGYAQPQPTPTYYQGPSHVSKYKPSGSLYGGGGYGSNAYGSYGGGYRAAVGDEEIAGMLHQQQLLPQITMPNDDDPLTAINTTATETDNADTTKNLNKRFAKNDHNNNNNSPAAYLVVVRDNNNSKKSRSKRSTEEFTTLEPIDENSLNVLRKTYKNSLKEITLNPNETPAEALMRYKAEAIREALDRANQVPMELTADAERYEGVKESKEAEAQQQRPNQSIPTISYGLRANDQFKAIQDKGPHSYMDNDLYTAVPVPVTIPQNQPLAMVYNQQPEVVYESPQEDLYNNYVVKYNSPAAYDRNPKILPQNRYLGMYNSIDTVPYVDEYSVDNQVYQMANPNGINANSFVYPQVNAKQLNTVQAYAIEAPNAITKEIQSYYSPTGHIMDYSGPKASEFTNYPAAGFNTKQNPYLFKNIASKHHALNTYSQLRPSQVEYSKRFNTVRIQEKLSFENLISVIKERLTQCCNECKNKILKSLDESLSAYSTPVPETYHTLTYRNPQVEENFEYKHWLLEMAEKGYDKNYLTNRHQEEYLKDGRLNLHITTKDGSGPEDDNMFFKNNQSYKRETTEPNMEKEAKTEIVIATIKTDNSLEKETNEASDHEEDHGEKDEEEEMVVEELQPEEKENEEKINTKPLKLEESIDKIEKVDVKSNENKTTKPESKQNSNNNTKPIGTAQSTTHSVYAMRGQFRAEKQRPKPFSMAQAKHFDNYKHINKIGRTNALIKTEEQTKEQGKSDKLEEIVILLPKENNEERTITPNKRQITTTESNVISKATSNETNAANKPKKIRFRKLRTSSKNQIATQNSSESNSSTESIG